MAKSDNTWNKKIKRAREEKGWSQEDLAERIGAKTTQNTISRWENGISKPTPYYRQRLSEILGKSIEELGLLENKDDTPPESEPIESEQTSSIANTTKPFRKWLEVIISIVVIG